MSKVKPENTTIAAGLGRHFVRSQSSRCRLPKKDCFVLASVTHAEAGGGATDVSNCEAAA